MSRVAVYSITRGKLELVKQSFSLLRRYSGIEYDHFVHDNGSEVGEWLLSKQSRFTKVLVSDQNLGQNLAANALLDEMGSGYDYVLRYDPDALPRTRRFLKKMVSLADRIAEPLVMSPEIGCLKHPPQPLATVKVQEKVLEVVEVLGGICRLHPGWFFDDWRFNEYGALGFGEAMEVADRCSELKMGMVRVKGLEVDHAYGEDGQAEKWPEQFGWNKEVSRYVGYGL